MTSQSPRPRPGQPAPGRRRSSLWVLGGLAVVVVAALVIALLVSRGGSDDEQVQTGGSSAVSTGSGTGGSDAGGAPAGSAPSSGGPVATAPVKVDGDALPTFEQTEGDDAVGRTVPELHGFNVLDGSPLDIINDGKPKLIFVVAHWCPHCQREVPLIQDWLSSEGKPAGVELYAVSTAVAADRGNYPPAAWLTKVHWSVPTMADSTTNQAGQALGLSSIPYFIAVDANGKVVQRATGEQPISAVKDMVAQLTK